MSESSYSVYLIHHPVIIVVSYYYIEYINDLNPVGKISIGINNNKKNKRTVPKAKTVQG